MNKNFTDTDLNRSVGNLLRLGVILAVITSLVGFVKLFMEGFQMPKKYKLLDMGGSSEKVWGHFWTTLCKGEGMAIISWESCF